jgi:NAD(P)H-flavin reductase
MSFWIPALAEVVEKRQETRQIFTLRLRFCDEKLQRSFRFQSGQFNMLYAFGVGEIPISIVSDPTDPELLDHTIRMVGPVSNALAGCGAGDVIGLRGPYGSSWPTDEARGKDVVILTGGLGCAPVVSVISYIIRRRESYGALKILHGIKTPKDFLYREQFRKWQNYPNTEVYLTVDHPDRKWKYRVGIVSNLFREVRIANHNTMVMICGPEIMMHYAVRDLLSQGMPPDRIYLSMERNMKCAVGLCGHCQFGPAFVCKDGPVFCYDRIKDWFHKREV